MQDPVELETAVIQDPIELKDPNEPFELPLACQETPLMKDWMEQEEPEDSEIECKPCAIPIATAWYSETLREYGLNDEADRLHELAQREDVDPLQMAEELDNIKNNSQPGLANRLRELDCDIQVNADQFGEEASNG